MKTVLQVLTDARALISDRRNWCQWAFYQRPGPDWHAYCAVGACRSAAGIVGDDNWVDHGSVEAFNVAYQTANDASRALQRQLVRSCSTLGLTNFNDNCTHQEILIIFDRAIAAKRKRLDRTTDISSLTALLDSRAPVAETV